MVTAPRGAVRPAGRHKGAGMTKADIDQGSKKLNQEFARYEQVRKDQTYGLSENETVDSFDEDYEIKTIDMAGALTGDAEAKARFADELGRAMEEIGFVVLTGHGVDTGLYDKINTKTAEFFETIPMAERQPYIAARHGSVNQGYFPVKATTIIHPDLVEGWVFCRRAFDLDGDKSYAERDYWPRSGYEPVFREVVEAHQALVQPLMQAMLQYLGCDPHLYDQKLAASNFGFRLNYYPVLDDAQLATGSGRMLGHEDVDLFTILPAANQSGLQVLNRANMKWIRLNPPKGSIILNTGDYMQRISNDRFPSTTHRVAAPKSAVRLTEPRISFPMAVYVWEDEVLEVLPGLGDAKYPPIRAEDFHTKITSKYYGDDYRETGSGRVK